MRSIISTACSQLWRRNSQSAGWQWWETMRDMSWHWPQETGTTSPHTAPDMTHTAQCPVLPANFCANYCPPSQLSRRRSVHVFNSPHAIPSSIFCQGWLCDALLLTWPPTSKIPKMFSFRVEWRGQTWRWTPICQVRTYRADLPTLLHFTWPKTSKSLTYKIKFHGKTFLKIAGHHQTGHLKRSESQEMKRQARIITFYQLNFKTFRWFFFKTQIQIKEKCQAPPLSLSLRRLSVWKCGNDSCSKKL